MTPLQQAAYDIGAKGSESTDEDRLSFESWMRGHCWALSSHWDGNQYVSDDEKNGGFSAHAMGTRRLWAAWRDRGALSKVMMQSSATQKAAEIGKAMP